MFTNSPAATGCLACGGPPLLRNGPKILKENFPQEATNCLQKYILPHIVQANTLTKCKASKQSTHDPSKQTKQKGRKYLTNQPNGNSPKQTTDRSVIFNWVLKVIWQLLSGFGFTSNSFQLVYVPAIGLVLVL